MEFAATFFYISAGLAIWIVGAFVVIVLIELVKAIKSLSRAADSVKDSVASFDAWKSAIVGAISNAATGFLMQKTKGGGRHNAD